MTLSRPWQSGMPLARPAMLMTQSSCEFTINHSIYRLKGAHSTFGWCGEGQHRLSRWCRGNRRSDQGHPVLERGAIPPIAQLGQVNWEIDAEFLKLKVGTVFRMLHPHAGQAGVRARSRGARRVGCAT